MRGILCAVLIVMNLQGQGSAGPPALHDPPRFRTGQIEASTDAGAHSSSGMASRGTPPLPVHGPATPAREAALRQAVREQPDAFSPNLAFGQILLEAGRAAEAIPALRAALRTQPNDIAARHDLAVALIETAELEEARSLLTALQRETKAAGIVNLEARWLAASGQALPAATLFQRAAEAEPSERHLFDWGNHLLSHGAAEPAVKIFRYAADRFPRSARLKVALGVAHYAQGEFDAAVRSVCEGVDLDPQDLRPLVFLGQMIDVSPQWNQQLSQKLEGFAKLYPSNAQAQYFYGLSLAQNAGKAEPYLRRAATLDPGYAEPRLALGKILADTGRDAEAIRELEAALRLSSDSDAAHYRLGQLYQRAGNAERSLRHFAEYRRLKAARVEREEQERKQRQRLSEKR